MSGHNDEVPVLSDVVESGNESIIQSSRLGREVLRELEVLAAKCVVREHPTDYPSAPTTTLTRTRSTTSNC